MVNYSFPAAGSNKGCIATAKDLVPNSGLGYTSEEMNYSYDSLNRVTGVSKSGGGFSASYAYDPGGRRVLMNWNSDPTGASGGDGFTNGTGSGSPTSTFQFYLYSITGQRVVTIQCAYTLDYLGVPTAQQNQCTIASKNVYFGGKLVESGGTQDSGSGPLRCGSHTNLYQLYINGSPVYSNSQMHDLGVYYISEKLTNPTGNMDANAARRWCQGYIPAGTCLASEIGTLSNTGTFNDLYSGQGTLPQSFYINATGAPLNVVFGSPGFIGPQLPVTALYNICKSSPGRWKSPSVSVADGRLDSSGLGTCK